MSRLGQVLVKVAASASQMLISQRRAGVRPISVARYLQREGEGTLRKGMEALHSLHEHHGLKKRAAADLLPGGKADNIPDSAFPKKELEKGTRIELEHTRNKTLAREIATDHLAEHPEYYDALVPMEHMLEKIEKKAAKKLKLQGHIDFQGLGIAVENRKGSVRKGVDADGTPWRTEMKYPYGYIQRTKGADGEEVDAYVGPDKKAPMAYVVHQHKADGTGFDEDKVMLGFDSEEEARKAYLAHYDDPKFLGPISAVPMERLEALVESGKVLKKITESTKVGTALAARIARLIDRKPYIARRFYADAAEGVAKTAGSMTTAARTQGEGGSRGVNSYIEVDDPKWGKPATAKVKPGDAPSMDEVPDYKGTTEGRIPMRQLDTAGIKLGGPRLPPELRQEIEAVLAKEDELKRTPAAPKPAKPKLGPLAMKVASVMGRLTHKEPPLQDQTVYQMGRQLNRDKLPTREQEDYAEWPIREREGFRQAGSDTPTDQYNPDWNKR